MQILAKCFFTTSVDSQCVKCWYNLLIANGLNVDITSVDSQCVECW